MTSQFDFNLLKRRLNATTTYSEHALRLKQEVGKRLLERLQLIKLKPTTIVELGSGTGLLAQALQQQFPKAQYLGIDIAQQRNCKNLANTVTADTRQLPLADNSADLVIANLCFHWLDDAGALFHDIQRILKPDGLLLFTTFGPDTLQELRYSWAQVDDEPHVHSFMDLHDIGDRLLAAGLKDPVMDVDNIVLLYEQVTDLAHDLRELGETSCHPDRRKSLTGKGRWQQMVETYEQFRGHDGKLPVLYEISYGHAWGQEIKAKPVLDQHGEVRINVGDILKKS